MNIAKVPILVSVLRESQELQTFLFCFDTAKFIFPATVYGETKPFILIRGLEPIFPVKHCCCF